MSYVKNKYVDFNVSDDEIKNLFHIKYIKTNYIEMIFKDKFKMIVKLKKDGLLFISSYYQRTNIWVKFHNQNMSNKSRDLLKYNYYCYNNIHKYIQSRRTHYFYKVNYDISKTFIRFEDSSLKYKFLKLRSAKRFNFYWNSLIFNEECIDFLKDNKWARQILIDFLCRFRKLFKIYRNKNLKWIIKETPEFYFKGWCFKTSKNNLISYNETLQNHNCCTEKEYNQFIKNSNSYCQLPPKKIITKYISFNINNTKIGYLNKTDEFVKLYKNQKCNINFIDSSIVKIYKQALFKVGVNNCMNYTMHPTYNSFDNQTEVHKNLLERLNLNIKNIYKKIMNKDYKIHISELSDYKILFKLLDSDNINYPRYLQRRIKTKISKFIIEHI